jgi:peptide/nickel transport system substrate-binding protein
VGSEFCIRDSSNAIFLAINDKTSPILADKKLREALRLAINKQGMLDYILKGSGRVTHSILSLIDNKFSYQQVPVDLAWSEYVLDESRRILKDISVPKQVSLLVMLDQTGNTREVASALIHMLNKVGIKVDLHEASSRKQWKKENLNYDLTIATWQTRLMSRDNIYEDIFLRSLFSYYLIDKFKQQGVGDDFHGQSVYFEELLKDNWIIPLFYQDHIWAGDNKFNLEEIFSSNGIPYWSLLRVRDHLR